MVIVYLITLASNDAYLYYGDYNMKHIYLLNVFLQVIYYVSQIIAVSVLVATGGSMPEKRSLSGWEPASPVWPAPPAAWPQPVHIHGK